jgi:hypothetical protein
LKFAKTGKLWGDFKGPKRGYSHVGWKIKGKKGCNKSGESILEWLVTCSVGMGCWISVSNRHYMFWRIIVVDKGEIPSILLILWALHYFNKKCLLEYYFGFTSNYINEGWVDVSCHSWSPTQTRMLKSGGLWLTGNLTCRQCGWPFDSH